jgi:hypothetical protein
MVTLVAIWLNIGLRYDLVPPMMALRMEAGLALPWR